MAFTLILPLLVGNLAKAETTDTITVSATVAPLKTVTIDKSDRIIQITSNTKEDIEPIVCVVSCQQEKRLITPQLLQKYQEIMNSVGSHDLGVIYQAPADHWAPQEKIAPLWQSLAPYIVIAALIL